MCVREGRKKEGVGVERGEREKKERKKREKREKRERKKATSKQGKFN